MPRRNTQQEIDEARDYLLEQLKAGREVSDFIDRALTQAARRLVDIAAKYNIPPGCFRFSADPRLQAEVRHQLALLRALLYDEMEKKLTFKAEDEKDGKYIPPILTEEDHGKTIKERIALYVGRWGYEVEAVIAGAGLAGVTDTAQIKASIEQYLHSPWQNPYFVEGTKIGGGAATRLKTEGVSYGQGRTNVAANGLDVALGTFLTKGYMANWFRLGRKRGAVGFWTHRNSSYPCDYCDEAAMTFHYITEDDYIPPLHPRCVCSVSFVYLEDIL